MSDEQSDRGDDNDADDDHRDNFDDDDVLGRVMRPTLAQQRSLQLQRREH